MLANISRRRPGWSAALLFAIATHLAMPAHAADAPEMSVGGKYNVNPTGAFIYQIPVKVPPGTAGLAPSLALNYSTQTGDGLEGLGWALSGLPSVTRCARTPEQDGIHGGINYDNNDRFCLEGQRLIATGTWSSCTAGVTYKTEVDSFSRIVSCGTSGAGPAYFRVWTKTGQIMEFGNTTDSKAPLVAVPGSTTGPAGTVRAWALNKISDTVGNYLTVTYDNGTQDLTNGQVYPTEIDYTGNASTTPTLAPYNSIKFTYQTRVDQTPMYQAGAVTTTTQLMTHIKTYAGAAAVSDYRLSYNFATLGDQHDELSAVTLCDGAGTCLAPTSFFWQGSRDRVTLSSNPTGFAQDSIGAAASDLMPGDFNGDGILDVIPKGGPHCGAFFGALDGLTFTGSGMSTSFQEYEKRDTTPPTWVPVTDDLCTSDFVPTVETYDIEGDGRSDFLIQGEVQPNMPALIQMHNTGTQFTQIPFVGIGAHQLADFNGDGLTDVLYDGGGILYSKGDGTYTSQTLSIGGGLYAVRIPSDFDGDGCADILTQSKDVHSITYLCNPAIPSLSVNWYLYDAPKHAIALGDFNGDGKTDILTVSDTDASTLHLSTGTGMATTTLAQSGWAKYTVVTGDFNGDGKTDVLLVADDLGGKHYSGSAHPHQLWLSTGTGFVQATNTSGAIITLPNNGGSQDLSENNVPTIGARNVDWNSDGASDIWLQKPSGDIEYLTSFQPEVISGVSNGLNVSATVTYDRLNKNGALYTKCPANPSTYACGDTYPTQGVDGALYVVARIDTSNGIGGLYSTTYAYGGAKADLKGRGFLGFQSVSANDLQTNMVVTTVYRTDFPYTGLVASRTTTHGAITVTTVTNSYSSTSQCQSPPYLCVYDVSLTQTLTSGSDLDGSPLPSTENDYSNYDAYGNPGSAVVSITPPGGGAADLVKTTTNTYTNTDDATHYLVGELTLSVVETQTSGALTASDITRHSGYSYDPTTGLMASEAIEPQAANITNLKITTTYGYDNFGNKQTVTVTGSGNPAPPACTTTTTYDAKGQFPIGRMNCLYQTESWTYDAPFSLAFGIAHTHTGPNGLTTTWSADSFGRQTQEARPDGVTTNIAYAWCSGVNNGTDTTCPANGATSIATSVAGSDGATQVAPSHRAYFDGLMRAIASDGQDFDGSWVRNDTLYDANERAAKTDRPYFLAGGAPQFTVLTYDDLGRVLTATEPNGALTRTAYHGLSMTTTNPLNQAITVVQNDFGKQATVTTNAGTTIFTYDALGEPLTAKDPAGRTLVTNVYDVRGRKTDSTDADMGHWHYVYDSLGRMVSQTDAKGQTTAIGYDVLNREVSRTEPDMTTTWTYDTATGKGIGQLANASCSGTACAASGYSRTYKYDNRGRQSKVTIVVGGASYAATTSYDSISGKVTTVKDFAGFSVVHAYNAVGYESEIDDALNMSLAYWKANARDAELHLTKQTAANGVITARGYDPQSGRLLSICATTAAGPCDGGVANFGYDWDALGNLKDRSDTHASGWQTEIFCYDNMNRLKGSGFGAICSGGQGVSTVGYDSPTGNIRNKSGVGTYTYGTGTGHGDGPGPHAVVSIASCNGCTLNGVSNPVFQYDADGNMTSGAGRTLTYASFNATTLVSEAAGAITTALTYDPEHSRIQQVSTVNGAITTTTYLNDPSVHDVTELVQTNGQNTWRSYISADGQLVALHSGTTTNYFVLDHLGSVAVIADSTGNVPNGNRQFYDAWGAMRNADGSADTSCALPAQSATTRGFTSQEEMASVCLVNFNARLYDPVLARFLSADSDVPAPINSQTFNRYSYIFDNPLRTTDPSGHFPIETVIVTAPSNPVVAAIEVVAVVVEIVFDLFAVATPPPTPPVTVAAPTPAQSPAAGGSETSVPQVQNTATAPPDTTNPTPTSAVGANSQAAPAPATSYSQPSLEPDSVQPSSGQYTVMSGHEPAWCENQCSLVDYPDMSAYGRSYSIPGKIETVVVEVQRCELYCRLTPYLMKIGNAWLDIQMGFFQAISMMETIPLRGAAYLSRTAEFAEDAPRGLSTSGGIMEQSVKASGGKLWTSTGAINIDDVGDAVGTATSRGEDVDVLSGVHGLPDGTTVPDFNLYNADVGRFGDIPGVNVYNMPELSDSEITSLLESTRTTVGGFCDSAICLAKYWSSPP